MKQPSEPKPAHAPERPEAKDKLPVTEWPTAQSLDRDAPRAAREGAHEPEERPWQPLGGERADNGND